MAFTLNDTFLFQFLKVLKTQIGLAFKNRRIISSIIIEFNSLTY